MNAARKLILVTASLPLFAAPAISHADAAAAMNACVNAFASANLPKEQKVRLKTLSPDRSPWDVHARYYRITLSAKGAESGKEIATGSCIMKFDGTVVAVNGKTTATPELAALNSR
jgi:hypothetical protein